MDALPRAPACERNRGPILDGLRVHFAGRRRVLEVGSGTGEHAVHFAAAMPWLEWHATDVLANLPGIAGWRAEAALPNTPPPFALDLADPAWDADARASLEGPCDAAFCANVLHIVAWPLVASLFEGLGRLLAGDAVVVVYGPFNEGGDYTAESNRAFDAWLRARDPASGIRDREAVDALAERAGFRRLARTAMPANNLLLAWRRG
ncbi:class I SAM-dependent methyltransferase [Luteimonas pelagia]